MAGFDRFIIAPLGEGLQTNVRPWLVSDTAYTELDNAYVFRGRVRRRVGSKYLNPTTSSAATQEMTRLQIAIPNLTAVPAINIGVLDAGKNLTLTGPAFQAFWVPPYRIGQAFKIGTETFPITALGTPATLTGSAGGSGTFNTTTGALSITSPSNPAATPVFFYPWGLNPGKTDASGNVSGIVPGLTWAVGQAFSIGNVFYTVTTAGVAQPMLKTGPTTTATYSTTTGAYNFVGAPINSQINFYPSTPVMGFVGYQDGSTKDLPCYAFDTQFPYQYTNAGWEILGPIFPAAGSVEFTGTDSNFFWGCTWRGVLNNDDILFVTNFKNYQYVNQTDGIQSWDGTNWTPLIPTYDGNANHIILTARIVIPFKTYLILLDTVEETGTPGASVPIEYWNRMRSCPASPFEANAFNQNVPGKGFYADAPTKERIISAQFLRDHLIVYFENSAWELVWTSNYIQPFVWQQINTELGAQSTFSEIPFDRDVLAIGQVGVHACSGTNVVRIDQKIPDEIFNIARDNNGPQRVWGIRDYFLEMAYWSLPDVRKQDASANTYPNRMLVYNYQNQTWSFNNDSITAFGYFEQQQFLTWGTANMTWGAANFAWNTPTANVNFKQIIAGNQEGFTFLMTSQVPENASVLQITNLSSSGTVATFTVINHNMQTGDYVAINNVLGMGPVTQDLRNGLIIGTTDALGDAWIYVPSAALGQQFSIGNISTSEIDTIVTTVAPHVMTSFNPVSTLPTFYNTISLGSTDGAGNASVNVALDVAPPYFLGQNFTVDTTTFTITSFGTPAALSVSSGGTGTATFNTTTGALVITGSTVTTPITFNANVLDIVLGPPNTAIYYYSNPLKFIGQITSIDTNTFSINTTNFSLGTYVGYGTVERVTPFDIWTKQFNFYTKEDKNCFVPKVDFFVSSTNNGEATVNYYTSSQTSEPLNVSGISSGAIVGTSILETSPYATVPYEQELDRLWHPLYFQATGESVQFEFTMTPAQVTDPYIIQDEFEIHAMTIYATPVSRLQ